MVIKLILYVSQELIDFLATLFGAQLGDTNYIAEFDIDKNGLIDTTDISWFAQRFGTWIELADPLSIYTIVAAIGGVVGGLAIAAII